MVWRGVLVLQCMNSACHMFLELPTSEKRVRGKARFYDVNRRSALAMCVIGRGRAALTKSCAVMNMPGPVAKQSFNMHVLAMAPISQHVAEAKWKRLLKKSGLLTEQRKAGQLTFVSCDGTWARRAFQSPYKMIAATEGQGA